MCSDSVCIFFVSASGEYDFDRIRLQLLDAFDIESPFSFIYRLAQKDGLTVEFTLLDFRQS